VPKVSFIVGEGRLFARPDPYPIATRVAKTSESFGNRWCSPRFGTEGSEVQILSLRKHNSGPVFRAFLLYARIVDGHVLRLTNSFAVLPRSSAKQREPTV
jgi:hypothetical protein